MISYYPSWLFFVAIISISNCILHSSLADELPSRFWLHAASLTNLSQLLQFQKSNSDFAVPSIPSRLQSLDSSEQRIMGDLNRGAAFLVARRIAESIGENSEAEFRYSLSEVSDLLDLRTKVNQNQSEVGNALLADLITRGVIVRLVPLLLRASDRDLVELSNVVQRLKDWIIFDDHLVHRFLSRLSRSESERYQKELELIQRNLTIELRTKTDFQSWLKVRALGVALAENPLNQQERDRSEQGFAGLLVDESLLPIINRFQITDYHVHITIPLLLRLRKSVHGNLPNEYEAIKSALQLTELDKKSLGSLMNPFRSGDEMEIVRIQKLTDKERAMAFLGFRDLKQGKI